MFSKIIEDNTRNATKLFDATVAATQKVAQQQIDFSRTATEQIIKINQDLTSQATTHGLSAMAELNQLWRETIVRSLNIPAAN
jgi:hypothetical protein